MVSLVFSVLIFYRYGLQEVPDFTSQLPSLHNSDSKPLKGLRIGVINQTLDDGVDDGIKSVVLGAISHLEELGCTVSEVPFSINFVFLNPSLMLFLSRSSFTIVCFFKLFSGITAFLFPWITCILYSSFI